MDSPGGIDPKDSCRLIRLHEARHFQEGAEECREYARSEGFWLGTSHLPPGAEGDTYPGHADHFEVFVAVVGGATVLAGEAVYELATGDALIIPPGTAHTLRNGGSDQAVMVWAGSASRPPSWTFDEVGGPADRPAEG